MRHTTEGTNYRSGHKTQAFFKKNLFSDKMTNSRSETFYPKPIIRPQTALVLLWPEEASDYLTKLKERIDFEISFLHDQFEEELK